MKHVASPSHIAVSSRNHHEPKRLPYRRVVTFVNFVKPADTHNRAKRPNAIRLTADQIATICDPKPVLGVRCDLSQQPRHQTYQLHPVAFTKPAVISGNTPPTRNFLCI